MFCVCVLQVSSLQAVCDTEVILNPIAALIEQEIEQSMKELRTKMYTKEEKLRDTQLTERWKLDKKMSKQLEKIQAKERKLEKEREKKAKKEELAREKKERKAMQPVPESKRT